MLGHGPLWTALDAVGLGGGGAVVSLMVMMFAVAQLASAPFWGRFSDKFGRRPALMVGLVAAAPAYLIFAYANSLELLFLCRIVQGAGGVTETTIGFFFTYVGAISFVTHALFLGTLVHWLGELNLSRYGMLLLAVWLAGMAIAPKGRSTSQRAGRGDVERSGDR